MFSVNLQKIVLIFSSKIFDKNGAGFYVLNFEDSVVEEAVHRTEVP